MSEKLIQFIESYFQIDEDRADRKEFTANLHLANAASSGEKHHVYVKTRGKKKGIAGPFNSKEEAEASPARKFGDGVATASELHESVVVESEHDNDNPHDYQIHKTHSTMPKTKTSHGARASMKGHITTTHGDSEKLRSMKDGDQHHTVHVEYKHPESGQQVRGKFSARRHGDHIYLSSHANREHDAIIKHSSIKPGPHPDHREMSDEEKVHHRLKALGISLHDD